MIHKWVCHVDFDQAHGGYVSTSMRNRSCRSWRGFEGQHIRPRRSGLVYCRSRARQASFDRVNKESLLRFWLCDGQNVRREVAADAALVRKLKKQDTGVSNQLSAYH